MAVLIVYLHVRMRRMKNAALLLAVMNILYIRNWN